MSREEEAIFRGADCGSGEAGGGGGTGSGVDAAGGYLGADVLSLKEAIWESAGRSGAAIKAATRRKCAAEAGGSGVDAGQGDAAGCAIKKIVKPSRRRTGVEYWCGGNGISQRRACKLARLARSTKRYCSRKDTQTALRQRLREIAQARVRYGYRKIRVLLNREGWKVGKKRVYRLYREEGLALRVRPRRRRQVAVHARERRKPRAANEVWSLDFVADQLVDGRRFRALTIVDVFARESLAIEVGQGLKGEDVVGVLNRVGGQRGAPQLLFCDNGSEFTSQVLPLAASVATNSQRQVTRNKSQARRTERLQLCRRIKLASSV